MPKVIEVKLGEHRPVQYFRLREEIACDRGDCVILKVERGTEYGYVVTNMQSSCREKQEEAAGEVVRRAQEEDRKAIETNRQRAQEAIDTCLKKVNERKLDMQIVDAEYSFDGSKVIFFFTAEGRIDFRALVKDLARIFKIRIELKQIGVRDKAKIVGGFGVCGRALCCSSYMKGFHPLSIKMPKEQNLPLNPSRISGICGRIKCCMAYEFQVYKQYAKNLPRTGDRVTTPQGAGRVFDVNILSRCVRVDLGEGKVTKVTYGREE